MPEFLAGDSPCSVGIVEDRVARTGNDIRSKGMFPFDFIDPGKSGTWIVGPHPMTWTAAPAQRANRHSRIAPEKLKSGLGAQSVNVVGLCHQGGGGVQFHHERHSLILLRNNSRVGLIIRPLNDVEGMRLVAGAKHRGDATGKRCPVGLDDAVLDDLVCDLTACPMWTGREDFDRVPSGDH
jgi:hypothetical protein